MTITAEQLKRFRSSRNFDVDRPLSLDACTDYFSACGLLLAHIDAQAARNAELEQRHQETTAVLKKAYADTVKANEMLVSADKELTALRKNKPTNPPLNVMMAALDAFYENENVPERGMMDAYEILRTAAQPAPVSVPDEGLCDFYEVDNFPDLVKELVTHVEQLQEAAKRNVKPWEDTFPETLLPAHIERIKAADDASRLNSGSKPLVVMLPERFYSVIQGGKAVMLPAQDGHWMNLTSVKEAIRAAGGEIAE